MDSILPPTPDMQDAATPRPAICPTCGLTADNAVLRRSEVVTMATYVCTNAHLFAVSWLEVA